MKRFSSTFSFLAFWFVVLAITLSVAFLFCVKEANAQEWDWSPPAKHHEAICSVMALAETNQGQKTQGWLRGSGVFIEYGELRGVLTVAHAMTGKKVIVEFSNGTKSAADDYTTDKYDHDLAFIFLVTPGSVKPARIAKVSPGPGSRVEIVTTGGPETRLRSFWATVKTVDAAITEFDCDVLSGDSGGGIFTSANEIMGIQSYGVDKIATGERWFAARGAGSASCSRIRGFLDRIVKARVGNCGPSGCPTPLYPSRSRPAGAAWRPAFPGNKPAVVAEPAPKPLDSRTPAPPYKVQFGPPLVDYDKLAKAVLLQIDLKALQGPAGPTGPAGRDGTAGRDGETGKAGPKTIQDLDAIAKAVKEKISGSIRIKVTPIPTQ